MGHRAESCSTPLFGKRGGRKNLRIVTDKYLPVPSVKWVLKASQGNEGMSDGLTPMQ